MSVYRTIGPTLVSCSFIIDSFTLQLDPIPAKSTKLETIPETDREYSELLP